jgi:transcriptional regulator with XRE-family HTH domain
MSENNQGNDKSLKMAIASQREKFVGQTSKNVAWLQAIWKAKNTAKQLAKEIGIPEQSLGRILRGDGQPTIEQADRIAQYKQSKES